MHPKVRDYSGVSQATFHKLSLEDSSSHTSPQIIACIVDNESTDTLVTSLGDDVHRTGSHRVRWRCHP